MPHFVLTNYPLFSHSHSHLGTEKQTLCTKMADFKHLVVAKFKEEVVVDDIIKGMHDLVSEIDVVKSFEWGQDLESPEMLRQGFTHSFLMGFRNKEEFTTFLAHPKHVEFSITFSAAIDKVVLLDFPAVLAKPITKPADSTAPPPPEATAMIDAPPAAELPAACSEN
uniref:Stress-response A/B barrel domain-containing protein n=1 Tax=Opuntia streptacantha TaxID=393608 RepID=A0A7C9D3P1_OPUST